MAPRRGSKAAPATRNTAPVIPEPPVKPEGTDPASSTVTTEGVAPEQLAKRHPDFAAPETDDGKPVEVAHDEFGRSMAPGVAR